MKKKVDLSHLTEKDIEEMDHGDILRFCHEWEIAKEYNRVKEITIK